MANNNNQANTMKQGFNKVKIIGVLKEKHLEIVEDQMTSENILRGHVVVTVNKENEIHEFEVSVYSKEFTQQGNESKLYKGYKTVMEEYKDSDTYSTEADTIEVTAELSLNEYYSEKNDKVYTSNRLRGKSFTRVDGKTEHCAEIVFKGVILGTKPEIDKEGIETGCLLVDCFIVGYRDTVIVPIGLKVPEDVVEPFQDYVSDGQTAKVMADLMRGVTYAEPETNNGFSKRKSKADTTYKNYTTSIDIFGVNVDENGYTEEEIEKMKKIRKKAQATIRGEEEIDEGKGFNMKGRQKPAPDSTFEEDSECPF